MVGVKNKCVRILNYARNSRIKINPKNWFKGVLLLLVGWGLIAIDSALFKEPLKSMGYKVNFLIQFATGMLLIICFLFFQKILGSKKLGVINFLKISHENKIFDSATLPLKTRKILIFLRGLIGAGGYFGFELAKEAVGTIDNSIIYGTDSLIYFIIVVSFLRVKYCLSEYGGIFSIILGLCFILFYDFISINKSLALEGWILGIGSAISLSIILILTNVIIQHDHPLRVLFYQCLCGFLISLLLVLIFSNEMKSFEFANFDFKRAVFEGVLYALAVYCLINAFYYVSIVIMAISAYSLSFYLILFNAWINKEIISTPSIVSTFLIVLGSAILIHSEYNKININKTNTVNR